MSKPILCLDFDGVCHSYTSGWQGADVIPDPPVEGLFEFLAEACQVFTIQIYSSRSHQKDGTRAMMKWFDEHHDAWFQQYIDRYKEEPPDIEIDFAVNKPSAFVTLDDRALNFNGYWPTMDTLINFKPWNK